eukprot:TRINITY_DN34558_c0_g1_i1.p1 TRINITY_DN34558_c0_g1~~TRINITY_DN34558_c0_g1_i1.p1  ORF type:complete len:773 (+),score=112.10 TRINITY_DN34558_c0_g1_i1:110-2428(+)
MAAPPQSLVRSAAVAVAGCGVRSRGPPAASGLGSFRATDMPKVASRGLATCSAWSSLSSTRHVIFVANARNFVDVASRDPDLGASSSETDSFISNEQLTCAVRKWWDSVASAPAFLALLDEYDVPSFFLKHDHIRDMFTRHLLTENEALSADDGLLPLLLLPPAHVLSMEAQSCAAQPEFEHIARPFIKAVANFIQASYARELATFRRARNLADLRHPHAWFPSTRRISRRWHLHLGPTNSGKTHRAAQQLVSAASGVYMSPLRLLAWEMYERMACAGLRCALRTGQEIIGPDDATHVACTVEMAPVSSKVDVGILDEVQLIVNENRGAAWTRALLGVQARELHICGTAEPFGLLGLLRQLALDCGDEVSVEGHSRMVPLLAEKKPMRGLADIVEGDCVICFTRRDILKMKSELEQLGRSPSVVYGSLPPEIRREQAVLFNDPSSGIDVMVASDAIGMGLNLQIRRVVFQTLRKFDGESVRLLTASEIRQIAGRAGRFGGRYGTRGLVTCLAERDHAIVRSALEEETPTPRALVDASSAAAAASATRRRCRATSPREPSLSLRAALFPLPEQLEAFNSALESEVGRSLPFEDLIVRFVNLAEVSPKYFVGESRGIAELARALCEVRLPPGEKFVFCQAPVAPRDVMALTALHDFARDYAADGHVTFPSVRLSDAPAALTARYVFELEELHKVCDLYLWLAGRFGDAFVNIEEAREARQQVKERISEALCYPLASDDADEQGVVFEGIRSDLPDETLIRHDSVRRSVSETTIS